MLWKIGQSFWINFFLNKAKIAPESTGRKDFARKNAFFSPKFFFFKLNNTFFESDRLAALPQ